MTHSPWMRLCYHFWVTVIWVKHLKPTVYSYITYIANLIYTYTLHIIQTKQLQNKSTLQISLIKTVRKSDQTKTPFLRQYT